MKYLILPAALALSVTLVTAPAAGQSLRQRIDAVRAQREKKDEQTRLKMYQALLYRDLSVEFDGAPTRDVFDYLRTALGINLVVRYSEDMAGHGIDAKLPITLSAQDTPALVILELVLEQCSIVDECTWQLRNGFVEVGTKERLSVPAARELRLYPVSEMLFEAPDFDDSPDLRLDHAFPSYGGFGYGVTGGFFGGGRAGYTAPIQITSGTAGGSAEAQRAQSLIELITDLVEPLAWASNGGDQASIRYHDGLLIISAPEYIQRQIFGSPKVPPPDPSPETDPEAPMPSGR
jgi:hypothetical protein